MPHTHWKTAMQDVMHDLLLKAVRYSIPSVERAALLDGSRL